jgi:hypothetical protein
MWLVRKEKFLLSGHRKKRVGLGDSECLVLGRNLLSLILRNGNEALRPAQGDLLTFICGMLTFV